MRQKGQKQRKFNPHLKIVRQESHIWFYYERAVGGIKLRHPEFRRGRYDDCEHHPCVCDVRCSPRYQTGDVQRSSEESQIGNRRCAVAVDRIAGCHLLDRAGPEPDDHPDDRIGNVACGFVSGRQHLELYVVALTRECGALDLDVGYLDRLCSADHPLQFLLLGYALQPGGQSAK